MSIILSVAIAIVTLTTIFLVLRFPTKRFSGLMPTSMFAFIAILFTSGLDVGLIMFPLTEFPVYSGETLEAGEVNPYGFTNPLAIMFGSWGFLIWTFYFLTTFYFCVIEPKLKLFEWPLIKFVNNVVIIGTCAFTGYLFLSYLPDYIEGITPALRYGLVAFVILCAVLSSTDIRYVKILSVSSTWVFFALIALMWIFSGMGLSGFVSRFVGNLTTWQLLAALLIFPSIPLALWFSVLYFYYSNSIDVGPYLNIAMIVVGVIFVMNSLDSLIRLYTDNLKLTVKELGHAKYVGLHWCLMFGLVLMYQFTPLKIEWVGLIVIAIYAVIYALVFKNRAKLSNAVTNEVKS